MRPHGLVSAWLQVTYRLAIPLARWGATANALSIAGVVLAALAVAAAGSPLPGRLVLAAAIVGVSGVADGLDGAVATLTQQSGRRGAVLDAVCDRFSDLLFAVTLWAAGVPAVLCCAVAAGFVMHEYLRAAARGAGLRAVTVITVSERPTRVIVVATFLLAAGTVPSGLGSPEFWLTAGAWLALGLSLIGMAQLTVWLHRSL